MWSVVAFDENTKLYTVSNEEGKTCRASNSSVVYGISGSMLKRKPNYNTQVCEAIKKYCVANCLGIASDFAYDLVMSASRYTEDDLKFVISIAKNHMDIVNDLESLEKVREVSHMEKHREIWPPVSYLFRNLVNDAMRQKADFEQFHKYIRALIEVMNCDNEMFYELMTDSHDKDYVIESVKNYKRLHGITWPAIDEELMNERQAIAYKFLAKHPDFAIQLIMKPIVDDMHVVFRRSVVLNTLEEFVDNCEAIGIEPKLKGNIITQMASVSRQAKIAKEKAKIENLRNIAETYSWLNKFSCNGFGVVVLGTPEEFEVEGKEQHNCVARYGYLEDMAKGKCIICGVRKLENMSAPYITCELIPSSDGALSVKQFFRAFNQCIESENEKEFLREFKKFINR